MVLSAELDDTAVVGEKYYVHFTLGNLSTNPINMLNLKIGSGDGNTVYRVLSENDLNKNFTVVSGDSIYVETLPPLGTLSFTYETVFSADTDINERLNLIEADISNSGEPIPIAVSYTHLDVYKRQPLSRLHSYIHAHYCICFQTAFHKMPLPL